jgi:protein-disulfide isomerase
MKRMTFGLVGAVMAGLVLTPALAGEFSDAQKSEIEGFIKDYLMKNPNVIKEALEELDRRQTAEAEEKAKAAIASQADLIYRSSDDLVIGNPKGSVTIVEFFDYNCGYCRKALPEIDALIKSDSDLKVVIKEFPILSPGSLFAAKAAIGSREQGKYTEFHDALNQMGVPKDETSVMATASKIGLDVERLRKDMEAPKVTEILQRTYALAESLGINGTPSFLVDQSITPGYVTHDVLAKIVADVRDNGGCKVC